MKRVCLSLALGSCVWPLVALAYELNTHALVTLHSFYRSTLNNSGLQNLLGLTSQQPFGNTYYDNTPNSVRSRYGKLYEKSLIEERGSALYTLEGWLMRGAIREDDYRSYLRAKNPQDDTYNRKFSVLGQQAFAEDNRIFNHFYDPVNRTPLTLVPHAKDAPTWAAGVEDAFGCPNCEDFYRRNHFTLRDARTSQWRAMTGQDIAGSTAIGPNGQQSDESVRNAYWATLFRSLGDVVHLVQDMGQPQHTRNEPHSPLNDYSKQVYEVYTEARALGDTYTCAGDAQSSTPAPPLSYGDYPIPAFDRYSEYFSTVPTDTAGDIATGRGLADYSNRGFFTAGNDLNATNYALPVPSPSSYSTDQASMTDPCIPAGSYKTLLSGVVPDTMTGAFELAPLSATGLWDLPAHPSTQQVRYTLNEDVYKKMGDLLIPRAVAYSAGLIDHFFRGRLEVELESYDRTDVTLRFRNMTPDDILYSENGTGRLIVTYRYNDDNGQEVFGTSDILQLATGDDVPPDELSNAYTFSFSPEIPVAARSLELRLVFRGHLGNESDAVAIGYKPMTSPGFLVQPSELPADGIAGLRHIYKEDGVWKLSMEAGLQGGNVDWKGWSRDDILSFDGPQSRYFYSNNRRGYSPFIYRKGRLLAQVPQGSVQGVGIRTVDNKRYLTALSFWGAYSLYVYSREYADSYPNNDMYDEQTNPLGWKQLAVFYTNEQGTVVTPFFMNASGTEAQGIVGGDGSTNHRFGTRIVIQIEGDTVDRQDFDISGDYTVESVRFANYQRTAAIDAGAFHDGDECSYYDTECIGGYIDCNGNQICALSSYDITTDSPGSKIKSSTYTPNQDKIIAVDYIGDQPVFSKFEQSGFSSTMERNDVLSVRSLSESAALSCQTGTFRTESNITVRYTGSVNESSGSRIIAGSKIVNTSWRDAKTTSNGLYRYTSTRFTDASGDTITTLDQPFSYTSDTDAISDWNYLTGMDLRTAYYAYAGRHDFNSYSDRETGYVPPGAPFGNKDIAREFQPSTREYSQYINLGDGLNTVHTWSAITDPTSDTSIVNIDIGGICPSRVDSDPTTYDVEYSASAVWNHMHSEAIKGSNTTSLQGYASDANGNVFVSQTLWEEQYPPPPGQSGPQEIGHWNYLTDGDPVALLGMTEPDPHFTHVGLY